MGILSLPQIATYISYALIIALYTVKVTKVVRMPPHLRWELYPIATGKNKHGGSYLEELEWWTKPRPKSTMRGIIYLLKNYLFFGKYLRQDRWYWFGLYPWHLGFYCLMGFQILSFFGALAIVSAGLSISAESANLFGRAFYYLTIIVAVASFATGSVGSIILLIKRLADTDLRSYAAPENYFNYVFFLVLFVSLFFAWYFDQTLQHYREFWVSLITFRYLEVEPALYLFVILFSLHLIHLPFTRSTHYITKLFAFFNTRWDDAPNLKGSNTAEKTRKILDKRVSWSAPHIQAGKKWSEVVTEVKVANQTKGQ